MKMRFFTIPIQDSANATGELNGFLSYHRILAIERHFVADGTNSAWAICVNDLDSAQRSAGDKRGGSGGRVDYSEILSDSDFTLFAKLRRLRKTLADRDGVPAYALFTNERLADMVRKKVTSPNALERISGVRPARSMKYGLAILETRQKSILNLNLRSGFGLSGIPRNYPGPPEESSMAKARRLEASPVIEMGSSSNRSREDGYFGRSNFGASRETNVGHSRRQDIPTVGDVKMRTTKEIRSTSRSQRTALSPVLSPSQANIVARLPSSLMTPSVCSSSIR